MSSLLACNAKHGFLYLAYQHKEVTRMTFAEKLKSMQEGRTFAGTACGEVRRVKTGGYKMGN